MPAPVPRPRDNHNDIADAVRDTVTVRGPTEYNTRNRVGRSHTAQAPTTPTTRPPNRRSHSQESHPHDKSKSKSKSKKGSQHADVIDRLDFTGVGPMFHHDGPFDACAPSRNRQRSNAPMFAWSPRQEDLVGSDGSAYPSLDAYKAFSNVDPPKKKVDAIAEAWGIHEPEPYEEFFAGGGTGKADADTPASSIYNGRDSHNRKRLIKEPARDLRREAAAQSPPADSARSAKRSVPPPQPIFVPDNPDSSDSAAHSSPPLSPGGNPQRKKSLMQRIRKMRDAPNVPVSSDHDQSPSPPATSEPNTNRPTHRPQNSFLGRFASSRGGQPEADKPEPFVYIEPINKELPPPPAESRSPPEVAGYFDSANGTNSGSPGIVRKTSLMKKVGRVVSRSRQ